MRKFYVIEAPVVDVSYRDYQTQSLNETVDYWNSQYSDEHQRYFYELPFFKVSYYVTIY